MTPEEVDAIVDGIVPCVQQMVSAAMTALQLRVAALEAAPGPRDGRDGQPGRDGAPGPAGMAGKDGVNGTDGLGFGDLITEHDGERTVTIKAVRGELVKTIGVIRLPIPTGCELWTVGKAYDAHDWVIADGSVWECLVATSTSKPGDGSKAWKLIVKRGRDGKDLR